MKLSKNELLNKLNIEEKKWVKGSFKDKQKLVKYAGYRLVDSYKVGREAVYVIESRGLELISVISFLKDYGIEPKQLKTFLNFLLEINKDGKVPLTQVAKKVGIATSTAYAWVKKIESSQNEGQDFFLKKTNSALKVKYDSLGNRKMCTDEEWGEFTDFLSGCIEEGINTALAYRLWKDKTGYIYKQVSVITSNGFYNEIFFDLLEEAINQLED